MSHRNVKINLNLKELEKAFKKSDTLPHVLFYKSFDFEWYFSL